MMAQVANRSAIVIASRAGRKRIYLLGIKVPIKRTRGEREFVELHAPYRVRVRIHESGQP